MIFSRIIYSSIVIGLVAGMLLTSLQIAGLKPIIVEAERFETLATEMPAGHGNSGHSDHAHGDDFWAPAQGLERNAYSFLANVLASTGFAAIVLALMSQFQLPRKANISWGQGSLWGLAGFATLFLAPAIGLPPEIPGAVSAALEHRQLWWALARTQRGHRARHFRFCGRQDKDPGPAVSSHSLHRWRTTGRHAHVSACRSVRDASAHQPASAIRHHQHGCQPHILVESGSVLSLRLQSLVQRSRAIGRPGPLLISAS